MPRVDDRAVFTAIVFVLTSGCAWRYLPPSFGVIVPTAHRQFGPSRGRDGWPQSLAGCGYWLVAAASQRERGSPYRSQIASAICRRIWVSA